MERLKRSTVEFPQASQDLCGALNKAWSSGWLDEFADDHFLIKVIEERLDRYQGLIQLVANDARFYGINGSNFQASFCVNFSCKVARLICFFGEDRIKDFFTNQLSAGKERYDEAQFFRALSEVSILNYWIQRSKTGEYEPRINGKKNPEARFICKNGVTIDIEVKTPGFHDYDFVQEFAIPTVLLNETGRERFTSFCASHNLIGTMPRVKKLVDFLNSAAQKFDAVDHNSHMNLLYVNWTFSEVLESGYEEALSILSNPINGILTKKDIGISLGVNEEVYEKITAVIVYTESLSGLMFGDFRWVWARDSHNNPHFGIVVNHNHTDIFAVTGMNPYCKQELPLLLYYSDDQRYYSELLMIIIQNMLRA